MNNWFNLEIIKEGIGKGITDAMTLQSVQNTASTVGQVASIEIDTIVCVMKQKGLLKNDYDAERKIYNDIKHEFSEHYVSFAQKRLMSVLQQQYPNYASERYTRDITNLIFDSKVPDEVKILATEEFNKASKDFLENHFGEYVSLIRKRYGLPPAPISPDDPENIRKKEVLKLLSEMENTNKHTNTNSRTNTNSHTNSNTHNDKQTKNLVGIVFWGALLGIYFFTSSSLISSALVALFFAAVVHFLVN